MNKNEKQRWQWLVILFTGLLMFFVAKSSQAASSVSWNFKDNSFKNLGTISSTITVDGISLNATSAKTMEVKASNQTVEGTQYTYALALGGAGNTSYRSVKVPVTGTSVLKLTCMSSGSSARTLVIADQSGTQLGTVSADTKATTKQFQYNGATGYIYLYSSNSNINLFKIQVDEVGEDSSSGGDNGNSGTTETGNTTSASNGTTVTSYAELMNAVQSAEKAGGGSIYVKGTTISCSSQLSLKASNANVSIIGLKNSDGSYPVLDFSSFRSSYIGKSTSDSQAGIRISGSKYMIKNLIIEKAPDNGIQIKGSSAGNNTIERCIVRYNNDAGLQITSGAYSNNVKWVCSYRNCDVYTLGGNADGFAPKLGAGKGNSFYGCYAWENSDDGWDSYDKETLTYDLSYEECAVWNNGDPTIFTGEYDYKKGNALDNNLLLVELIIKQDSNFTTNYVNGKFSLPTSSFISTSSGTLSISNWISKYDGNPNGFKFGSANTTSSCTRTVKNCLAFGHGKKGFDNNNSSCKASMVNTVSFDNKYNYYFPLFTITTMSNNIGFSGSSSDKLPSGCSITTASSSKASSIRSTVNSTVKIITDACKNNKIPTGVYFNIY